MGTSLRCAAFGVGRGAAPHPATGAAPDPAASARFARLVALRARRSAPRPRAFPGPPPSAVSARPLGTPATPYRGYRHVFRWATRVAQRGCLLPAQVLPLAQGRHPARVGAKSHLGPRRPAPCRHACPQGRWACKSHPPPATSGPSTSSGSWFPPSPASAAGALSWQAPPPTTSLSQVARPSRCVVGASGSPSSRAGRSMMPVVARPRGAAARCSPPPLRSGGAPVPPSGLRSAQGLPWGADARTLSATGRGDPAGPHGIGPVLRSVVAPPVFRGGAQWSAGLLHSPHRQGPAGPRTPLPGLGPLGPVRLARSATLCLRLGAAAC